MNGQAADAVKGPAIGLIVWGAITALWCVVWLVLQLIGVSFSAIGGGDQGVANLVGGGIGIVVNILAIVMAGFGIYGALQMMKLNKHGLAVAASVVAMLPCSLCCFLGLPIGIWALVVLMKPEVKAAFVG